MELRELRYFVAAAQTGSLTAAAAELHLSQPALSVAIQKLEAEVGAALLVRSARGVTPTSAGRFVLDSAARLLGEADDLVLGLRRFSAGAAGALTLAAVPALSWRCVPLWLRAHAREHPDVEVRVVDPPPWEAIEQLHRRAVDIAAIIVDDASRFARRHRGELDIIDLGPVPLVAVLPPGTGAGDPVPLTAFEGETLVLPRSTAAVPSLPEAVLAALRRHRVQPGRVRTTETIQAGIPIIEAGLGWAILPDAGPAHEPSALQRFDVERRALAPAVAPLRALALVRAGAASDPALARFLESIVGIAR
ncbi:LysR family transcriptional regulator [Microcella sp.]|uniref:LysR family transcriptional regulator n=1 Tax=Microcella sp. TaxID=1913979 RepID=UPI003919FA8B